MAKEHETMRRWITIFLVAALLGGGLAACGKKGAPEAPSGKDAPYPRTYPSR